MVIFFFKMKTALPFVFLITFGWHGPYKNFNNFNKASVENENRWYLTSWRLSSQILLSIFPYLFLDIHTYIKGFPSGSDGKESAYNEGDLGPIPGLGRSPGEGNGNSLYYFCQKNPMDRGAWRATVHGVTKRPRAAK